MIHKEELRVGNNVQVNGIRFYVSEILRDGKINCVCEGRDGIVIVDITNCEPIPLTSKILKSCGFIKGNYGENYFNSHEIIIRQSAKRSILLVYGGKFSGYHILYGDSFDYNNYQILDGEYKYVHQLQNIYFALTGEELKLK